MEATFNWPWVADLAEKCGLRPRLGDPTRIKDYRKGLPKSDRKDCIAAHPVLALHDQPEIMVKRKWFRGDHRLPVFDIQVRRVA